ncbi:MAG: hypothetical protein ACKO38_03300 [Planctomycetota bacterium]
MQRPSFALLMLCGALALGLTVADRTSRPRSPTKVSTRSVARMTKSVLSKTKAFPATASLPTVALPEAELSDTVPTPDLVPTPELVQAPKTATAVFQVAPPGEADAAVEISTGESHAEAIPSWLLTGDEDPLDSFGSAVADGSGNSPEFAAAPATDSPTTDSPTTAEPTTAEPTTVEATKVELVKWSLSDWVVHRITAQRAAISGTEVQGLVATWVTRLHEMAPVVDRMVESLRGAGGEILEAATRQTTAPQAGG